MLDYDTRRWLKNKKLEDFQGIWIQAVFIKGFFFLLTPQFVQEQFLLCLKAKIHFQTQSDDTTSC